MTREEQYINDLIGKYLSNKLAKSWYKYESREKQLAYMIGLLTAIVTDSCQDDNITLHKLIKRFNESNK